MFDLEGVVKTSTKIRVISITFLLVCCTLNTIDFMIINENVSAEGFPRDIFIEIHRIMEIDEIDPGSGADWYFYVGVDEGSGYNWKRSSIPYENNLNHLVITKVFSFVVSTSPISVGIRLCEDDFWWDDLADISSYSGEGGDDSTNYRRGATCVVSYDLDTHSWSGDVGGSTSDGYSETNGEWDGSYGGDTNDAALWFMIWDDMRVDITRPIFTVPLIQPKSDEFDIGVALDNLNPPSSWKATIFTGYDFYDLQIKGTTKIDTHNWVLKAQAPDDARYDLYDLKVEVDGIWDIEPNAISLIPSFSTELKFIHITDLHIDDPNVEFGGGLGDNVVEADILSSVIKEINLIYPDFVIASGDIGDNPEMIGQNEVRQYEVVKEVLKNLDVPIYVVNGNHDYDSDFDEGDASILEYRDLINPYQDFSWDYGPHHFIGLDSGEKAAYYGLPSCMMGKGLTNNQINWLYTDLDNNDGNGLKFAFIHHTALDPDECPEFPYYNSSISRNQIEFLDMCKQNQVSMVLTGHTHIDEVWDRDGNKQIGSAIGSPVSPLYIQTKSATHDDFNDNHGYRLVRISGNTISDYTYDRDGNGLRDGDSSIIAGELSLTCVPSNNGTVNTVTATIENNLHENFNDARIVFKMPKPQTGRQYYAINGVIEQRIEGPTHDVYIVKTDISKLSSKDVILQQGYPMELKHGWNLISLPLIQSETDLNNVLSSISGSYDAVQYYNTVDACGSWKHNNLQKPPHLNDLNDIDHTMGLWVHITEIQGTTLFIDGAPPSNTQSIFLHEGWNLVGYPSLTTFNRSFGLNNLVFGIDINAIWAYNAVEQKWVQLGESDFFQIGRGYYIHAKTECNWEVPL